jgi:hypothetical protein
MRGGGKNVFHVLLVGEEKAFSKDGYFKVRNYLEGQWSGMDGKLLLRGLGHDVKKINYFSSIQILKERVLSVCLFLISFAMELKVLSSQFTLRYMQSNARSSFLKVCNARDDESELLQPVPK